MSAQHTLEQQFAIKSFAQQVNQMSREQAQDFLIKLYEQMMLRENIYKEMLKRDWGIESISQGVGDGL